MFLNKYGKESTVSIYGEVNVEDRKKAVERIQTDEMTFFGWKSYYWGFGLTLTACNTVIYFSNNYNLEVRKQSEDRAHRMGQKGTVVYIDIVARNTLDEAIMKSLTNKGQIAAKTLGEEDLKRLASCNLLYCSNLSKNLSPYSFKSASESLNS